ncbi:MAG: chalcone isomerase family protein [Acinetobacter sp.]|jgi:hypothetical protein
MVITIQKIALSLMCLTGFSVSAATVQQCTQAPILIGKKQVGQVSYLAESCQKAWDNQSIQMNFAYTQDIPEWAFKRAATHFLKKNITDFKESSALNRITQLYKPVKNGDLYTLTYVHSSQILTLSLNQKTLGLIQHNQANQYFKIWLGPQPFSAKLKQQLLN